MAAAGSSTIMDNNGNTLLVWGDGTRTSGLLATTGGVEQQQSQQQVKNGEEEQEEVDVASEIAEHKSPVAAVTVKVAGAVLGIWYANDNTVEAEDNDNNNEEKEEGEEDVVVPVVVPKKKRRKKRGPNFSRGTRRGQQQKQSRNPAVRPQDRPKTKEVPPSPRQRQAQKKNNNDKTTQARSITKRWRNKAYRFEQKGKQDVASLQTEMLRQEQAHLLAMDAMKNEHKKITNEQQEKHRRALAAMHKQNREDSKLNVSVEKN